MIASSWSPKYGGSNCSSSDSEYDEEGCCVYRRVIYETFRPNPPTEPTEKEMALWWGEFFIRWHKKVRVLHRAAVYRTERVVQTFFKKVNFHLRMATVDCPSTHWNIHVREGL